LRERGDRVDIICLHSKRRSSYNNNKGIRAYPIIKRDYKERYPFLHLKQMIIFFFLSAYVCTKLHLKEKYDLIHFHNIPDFGVFCTLIPKLLGVKVILDIHDVVPEFYMRKFSVSENHIAIRFLKWIERISAGYVDHVITVTDVWRDRLIERSVKPPKCTVILNAPYNQLFYVQKPRNFSRNGRFMISYHGNLTEPTGVEIGIKALSIAVKTIPTIQFQIIGKGRELDNLRKLTQELMLEKNVRFIKDVALDKIPELISEADVGLDTKKDGLYAGETLSVKAMEYLAMHIPLIISRTKTAQAYFDDSMVMFFKPGDEKDLARCILELYESPHKRDKLVKNANRFNKEYRWEKYKKIYYHLIDNL